MRRKTYKKRIRTGIRLMRFAIYRVSIARRGGWTEKREAEERDTLYEQIINLYFIILK